MSVTLISFSFMKASPDADMAEPCAAGLSFCPVVFWVTEADSSAVEAVASAPSASDSVASFFVSAVSFSVTSVFIEAVSAELSLSMTSVLSSSALGSAIPVQPIRSVAQSIAVIICTVFIFIVFASDLGP